MKRLFSGIIIAMLCIGVSASAFRIQPVKADGQLELMVTVEQTDYYVGEPVNVTLTIINIGDQPVGFGYGPSQFDFLVYNDTGLVYWYSRSGIALPQFIIDVTIDPGQNVTDVLTWPQTVNATGNSVSPGSYNIYGWIPSHGLQAGPVQVNVDLPISLAPLKTVIGQGYVLPLNVSLINLDDPPWAFDVTLSSNATTIGTETGVNVSGSSILSFSWNTTNFPCGNYNLNVTAGNLTAETSVVLTIPGDIKGDFKVSLDDLVVLANAYGSRPDDARWNPNADIDGNGVVGLSDLVLLAIHYGQHSP